MASSINEIGMPVLSIVIPLGGDTIDLGNMVKWITASEDLLICGDIQIIIAFDEKDSDISRRNFQELKKISQNIVIISDRFNGPGPARNAGLTRARGRWIQFADADDLNFPNVALEVLKRFKAEKYDLIIFGFSLSHRNHPSKKEVQIVHSSMRTVAHMPGVWRMIFRRETIRKEAFPALKMAEDQIFLMDYFTEVRRIRFVRESAYCYFMGDPQQLTNNSIALSDLTQAIELSKEIVESSKFNSSFLLSMHLRQIVSKLLHVDKKSRFEVVQEIVKRIFASRVAWKIRIYIFFDFLFSAMVSK